MNVSRFGVRLVSGRTSADTASTLLSLQKGCGLWTLSRALSLSLCLSVSVSLSAANIPCALSLCTKYPVRSLSLCTKYPVRSLSAPNIPCALSPPPPLLFPSLSLHQIFRVLSLCLCLRIEYKRLSETLVTTVYSEVTIRLK